MSIFKKKSIRDKKQNKILIYLPKYIYIYNISAKSVSHSAKKVKQHKIRIKILIYLQGI